MSRNVRYDDSRIWTPPEVVTGPEGEDEILLAHLTVPLPFEAGGQRGSYRTLTGTYTFDFGEPLEVPDTPTWLQNVSDVLLFGEIGISERVSGSAVMGVEVRELYGGGVTLRTEVVRVQLDNFPLTTIATLVLDDARLRAVRAVLEAQPE